MSVWVWRPHLCLGPPRSEGAEAGVLGSGPTYRLHCLLWPACWSTGKKAGRAGLGSSLRIVIAIQVLHSLGLPLPGRGGVGSPGHWLLLASSLEGREG